LNLLSLPGQAMPPELDFDTPTLATPFLRPDSPVQRETPANAGARLAEGSGAFTRPPLNLDPAMPAETSASMRRHPVALDPSLPPRRGASLASLDPAIEGSGSVKRPPAEVGTTRQRPSEVVAQADKKARGLPMPMVAAGVGVAVVVVGLIFGGGGGHAGSRLYSVVDERRLTDLWLTHGATAWGGVRPADGVTRAVEGVGATLVEPMAKRLRGRTPRFVVLNDDGSAQVLALPDGSVAITAATLRRLGSEAQLAALLAHTMAHTATGDVAAILEKRADLGGVARAALDSPAPDAKSIAAAVELVAIAGTSTASVATEAAADDVALDALQDAGWSTSALHDAIRNLGLGGGSRRAPWLTQHQDDASRMTRLGAQKTSGRTGDKDYTTKVLDVIGRLASSARLADRGPRSKPTPPTPVATTPTPVTTTSPTPTPTPTTP
jgi:hypothetical protein